MDTEYRQFRSSDSSPVYERESTVPTPRGLKNVVSYFLYGILVLLLLILLMVTGIKFSQLNKEITEVKNQLERISKTGGTSSSHSGHAAVVQDVPLEPLVPVRGTCREGWSSFKSGCYLLSTTFVTWHRADEQCKAHGSHLFVPNNVEELDYISQIVEINHDFWIGLVEREEGHWTWLDGTDFSTTTTYWDEGQPDDWDFRENGEDCGQLHSSAIRKRKLWNDADCGLKYRYICESKA
ncbi:asialoglycoprotein receptor-like 1 [Cheilinus undulatus]|uniref:asialoglycoprotein receptor-like 1 n=1 Tax=Cheilinus undulatus TaxID=241271 RepID=UPI001BD4439A|nr:asialoglycoprotein receptor-like 1 [Cheilinus undulatus]